MIKICMLAFSYYPADPRVRREAEALVEAGMSIDVICLKSNTETRKEFFGSICVYRLPLQRKRGGKLRYLWEYAFFILLSFFKLSFLHLLKRYKLVHVHNMPDILIFSALIPRLTGAKIILDLHDPMPEVYMAKYSISISHPMIKLLCFLENYSISFSNIVLTPNISFRNLFISRGCPEEKIHIIMNSPDEKIFRRNYTNINTKGSSSNDKFVIMYHGTIVERNGLNVALNAISKVRKNIPNILFQVYGEGDFVKHFLKRVEDLNLQNIVNYHGHVSLETIATDIRSIDIGLIPNNKSVFTEINMPTRIFEYLCMGKPVIASRTRGILDYFDEDSLCFFEPGNSESLSEVILGLYSNPLKSQTILNKGITVYKEHRWELERQRFLNLVRDLLGIEERKSKLNST